MAVTIIIVCDYYKYSFNYFYFVVFNFLRTENFAGELVYFGHIDNLDRRR